MFVHLPSPRNGATWMWERMTFIPCFQGSIIHQVELAAHMILWRCRDNRIKAPKSSFEWLEPFADPIRPELVAVLSEARIHSNKYPFMTLHSTQTLRIMLSEDMLRCIIERAIRPTSTVKNCMYNSVQLTYDVERCVLELVCFTTKAISMRIIYLYCILTTFFSLEIRTG
jgi:hypothetical protein